MNSLSIAMPRFVKNFIREESGAQVIEYALIIAVVSLTLLIALSTITAADFGSFIGRVKVCLTGTATCV